MEINVLWADKRGGGHLVYFTYFSRLLNIFIKKIKTRLWEKRQTLCWSNKLSEQTRRTAAPGRRGYHTREKPSSSMSQLWLPCHVNIFCLTQTYLHTSLRLQTVQSEMCTFLQSSSYFMSLRTVTDTFIISMWGMLAREPCSVAQWRKVWRVLTLKSHSNTHVCCLSCNNLTFMFRRYCWLVWTLKNFRGHEESTAEWFLKLTSCILLYSLLWQCANPLCRHSWEKAKTWITTTSYQPIYTIPVELWY